MEPAAVLIDGQIDLVGQASTTQQGRDTIDRQRTSRLIDVMIVLERERASIEDALQTRLTAGPLANGIENLTLELDESEPKFTVTINRTMDAEAVPRLTAAQRAELETETTAEIVETIEKHAAYSETPRWQPNVTALYRPAVGSRTGSNSIWLHTLLWLLAIVILGVAYLYLKQPSV